MSIRDQLTTQMRTEVRAMASHALGTGLVVSARALKLVARIHPGGTGEPQAVTLDELARVHSELSGLVAPERPEFLTILYKDRDATRLKPRFRELRVAQRFILAALLSLAAFLWVSFSPYLNDPRYGDFFAASGWPLFVNEMFYLSSAALGASFAILFRLNHSLTSGTFRPSDESSYWMQFLLGIVAGLLLATLLNLMSAVATDDETITRMNFSAAALALLGGFSCSVVQKFVQRLVDALETIVRGSGDAEIQVREQAGKLRIEEALAKERLRATLLLGDIQRRLDAGESPKALLRLLAHAGEQDLLQDATPLYLPPPGEDPTSEQGTER